MLFHASNSAIKYNACTSSNARASGDRDFLGAHGPSIIVSKAISATSPSDTSVDALHHLLHYSANSVAISKTEGK